MSESPLISVKELEAELSDDNLLILDVRASLTDPAEGRRLYEACLLYTSPSPRDTR